MTFKQQVIKALSVIKGMFTADDIVTMLSNEVSRDAVVRVLRELKQTRRIGKVYRVKGRAV